MKSNIGINFGWKPLISIPENIPSATFIQGDGASEFIDEFRSRAVKDYGNASALNVFSYAVDSNPEVNELVRGSNVPSVVLANQIVRPMGMRTATPADLEKAVKTGALNLSGRYVDTGIVIRSEEGANDYLAKSVMAQVRAREPKVKFPIMIPLAGLDLIMDGNSPYGLGFKLREDAEVIYAPILNKEGNFNEVDESIGLPRKITSNGGRHLYIRSNGLSRLYLRRNLDLYSDYDNLANSGDGGRVVLVRDAGTAANFLKDYSTKQNANLAEIRAKIDTQYQAGLKEIEALSRKLGVSQNG